MGLSCICDYRDPSELDWLYTPPTDYSTLNTARRKRCSSCKELIDIGAVTAEFPRVRMVRDEIEERIYGECGDIDLASYFLCETCADLYFSLSELGFNCVAPDEDMRELVKQYNQGNYGDNAYEGTN